LVEPGVDWWSRTRSELS